MLGTCNPFVSPGPLPAARKTKGERQEERVSCKKGLQKSLIRRKWLCCGGQESRTCGHKALLLCVRGSSGVTRGALGWGHFCRDVPLQGPILPHQQPWEPVLSPGKGAGQDAGGFRRAGQLHQLCGCSSSSWAPAARSVIKHVLKCVAALRVSEPGDSCLACIYFKILQ